MMVLLNKWMGTCSTRIRSDVGNHGNPHGHWHNDQYPHGITGHPWTTYHQRLRKFFPPGTYVVSMDDDVERRSVWAGLVRSLH